MCLICDLLACSEAKKPTPEDLAKEIVWVVDVMMNIHNSMQERGVEMNTNEGLASTIMMRVLHKEGPRPDIVISPHINADEASLELGALLDLEVRTADPTETVNDIINKYSKKGTRH